MAGITYLAYILSPSHLDMIARPWSIDQLDVTRARCITSPPLCTQIFPLPLTPTADQLAKQGWSLEHGVPCTQFLLSSCHEGGTSFLRSVKIYTRPWAFQKPVTAFLCGNPSITAISRAPTILRSLEGNAKAPAWLSGTQMLHGTGLGLLGKELGLLFPAFCHMSLQHGGSFAFSFYQTYNRWDLNFPKKLLLRRKQQLGEEWNTFHKA